MLENLPLFVHNVGYILSALIIIPLAVFVAIKGKNSLPTKMLASSFVAVTVFIFSHFFGVNTSDPGLSRLILTFNLSNIFIGVFITHSVLAFLGKVEEQKRVLVFIYTISVSLVIMFLSFPDTFLLQSVPKMYFPNYYDGGSLYWLLITWNISVTVYFLYQMARSYRTADTLLRNRLKYFFTAFFLGYAFGCTAYAMVIDIPINPAWSALMVPSFAFPFTYAILKFDLLDIRVVFKHAFIYSVLVAAVGIFIVLFNILNNLIVAQLPGFPLWLMPLVSSSVAVAIGFYVWNQFRQGELLKYEFITVVTHKFRTPLTHIKWAAENLGARPRKDEDQAQLAYIQSANLKLMELTDLLMTVSETEGSYSYKPKKTDLTQLAKSVLGGLETPLQSRHINLIRDFTPEIYAMLDENRIKFVLQTLIENAINYSPPGGTIVITTKSTEGLRVFSVTDTGIGIPKAELPLLFAKFYRGKKAKLTDTEGMGIGLFISREILARHNGKIWAESEGEGKGSTFSFSVPQAD